MMDEGDIRSLQIHIFCSDVKLYSDRLGGAENFFKPISNICTTTSSLVIPLIFCQFSIINLIENNEFTGFQEFSAPLRAIGSNQTEVEINLIQNF